MEASLGSMVPVKECRVLNDPKTLRGAEFDQVPVSITWSVLVQTFFCICGPSNTGDWSQLMLEETQSMGCCITQKKTENSNIQQEPGIVLLSKRAVDKYHATCLRIIAHTQMHCQNMYRRGPHKLAVGLQLYRGCHKVESSRA